MMNCRHVEEQLSACLDGELTPREAENVRAHLASCASCRAAFEQLQRTVQAVKDLPVVPAPEGFRARVMTRVESEPGTASGKGAAEPPRMPRWRMLWPVAAAVLIAVVLALIDNRPKHPRSPKSDATPMLAAAESPESQSELTRLSDEGMESAADEVALRAPASPPSASDSVNLSEEPTLLADEAAHSTATRGSGVVAEKSFRGGAFGAASVESVPAGETGLAFAKEEPARMNAVETPPASVAREDSRIWTVVATDPAAARARLDAIAVENRWKPLPGDAVKDEENTDSAPRLDLVVLETQLPALSQAIKDVATPAVGPLGRAASAKGKVETEAAADIAAMPPRMEKHSERLRTIRTHADEGAEPPSAPADAVRVTVFFRAPEALIVPPRAASIEEAPADVDPAPREE